MLRNKIRAVMVENGETNPDLARLLGLSETSISNKINGKTDFSTKEIALIMEHYSLTPQKVCDIFFSQEYAYEHT